MSTTELSERRGVELSVRGVILGIAITLLFTAANVYLGLKVGLTFASSIPAAVISMAVLSVFPGSNIRENNIVQTLASAAGALASIIFVLPGLVIVGWWTGFPYWESFLVCASGGTLGVLFTIPLRRALVTHSDLPYPEGVAAAEVLKVGSGLHEGGAASGAAREGLLAILLGAVASAGLAAFAATRIAAGELQSFFRLGPDSATGYDLAFSLALLGAGHLVGLSVGVAMLIGLLIAWAGAVPILTALQPDASAALDSHVMHVWSTQVRFIGAGAMAVAALWTLARLAHPLVSGFIRTVAASRATAGPSDDQSDRDLSGRTILGLTIVCLFVIAVLLWNFAKGSVLATAALPLTLAALPFVVIAGFVVAAICGYMAGLIGSSNSPVSGVGILAVVTCAAMLLLVAPPTPETAPALVAFALFATAIVFGVAVTSNDNLQDLKTGQLVGAAPWRQQIALVIGIIAGALVIPPILNLLAQAYGFAGAPNITAVTAKPLPAPQANLISTLALGVIGRKLDWNMIGIGAGIGAAIVATDSLLARINGMRLPPLAVGMGIYLPMSATLPVTIGSLIGWWYNRRVAKGSDPARATHLGVLVASGMIVGESLFGVLLAGLIVGLNSDAPLALVASDFAGANALGALAFVAGIVLLYGWMLRRGTLMR
ncbi:MAG TPA: oligopeptide transporter, OPT family [Micropepsaceae bacterium]|nr:oligopeptide transporter, OPT family [Micropepsaceae bacterium]